MASKLMLVIILFLYITAIVYYKEDKDAIDNLNP